MSHVEEAGIHGLFVNEQPDNSCHFFQRCQPFTSNVLMWMAIPTNNHKNTYKTFTKQME